MVAPEFRDLARQVAEARGVGKSAFIEALIRQAAGEVGLDELPGWAVKAVMGDAGARVHFGADNLPACRLTSEKASLLAAMLELLAKGAHGHRLLVVDNGSLLKLGRVGRGVRVAAKGPDSDAFGLRSLSPSVALEVARLLRNSVDQLDAMAS